MASKATYIHASGFTFPGGFSKDNYCWEYPVIEVPKANGGVIRTRYYVGLLRTKVEKDLVMRFMNPVKEQKPNPEYNPNFGFSNFAVKLDSLMLDHHSLGDHIAFYVTSTQHGDGHQLYRVITFVLTGKSLNTKKRTNVLTQALANVFTKYNAKANVSNLKTRKVITPMLAVGEGISSRDMIIDKVTSIMNSHTISGVYVQPKYDGIRTMATLNPEYAKSKGIINDVELPYVTNDEVVAYSRNSKQVMIDENIYSELRDLLVDIAKKFQLTSLTLDGEFYCHGMSLQEISGYARGSHSSERKHLVNFIVYDYHSDSRRHGDDIYANRHTLLEQCRELFDVNVELSEELGDVCGHVLLSETKLFYDVDSIMRYYDEKIEDGYEGIMIRLPSLIYESARSKSLIKIKPTISYEYECIGYDFGVGKDSDIPTIKCKVGEEGVRNANDWLMAKNGSTSVDIRNRDMTFGAKFKGISEADQRKLGVEFQIIEGNGKTRFENQYLGRMATIEFLNFSLDGKPEKPNCLGFQ